MEDKEKDEIKNEELINEENDKDENIDSSDDDLKKEDEKQDKDEQENEKKENDDIKNDPRYKLFEDLINDEELRNAKKVKIKLRPSIFFGFIFLMVLFAYLFFGSNMMPFNEKKSISYSQFVQKINSGEIKSVSESVSEVEGIGNLEGKTTIYTTNMVTKRIGEDTTLMTAINTNNVDLTVKPTPISTTVFSFILAAAPIILTVFIFMYINKTIMGASRGGRGINPFGSNRSSKISEKPKVKFSDVAGLKEEKEELKEIVDFLKDPSKFEKTGARVPKGVLLLGEPGTGKTLLAKAVAGETGAAFFSMSGSEFVELYVGAGALKVRELFADAKKETPAIIFIDEIDAVGRKRNQGKMNGGNEEREQTLNQLLVEMDGFETDQRIIVMAATNRADILDPALLRGGRFDRRIEVSAPDVEGRIQILKLHSRNKKLSKDVKLEDIAKITPGFVGADLENLLNEAAILAARKKSDTITMEDLDEAVDKIGMGLGQRSKIISQRDRDMLAYHEGGHALIASLLPEASKVHKVTIIPRGDAGGFMMPLPEETLGRTKKQLLAEINVLFGGRAGESLMMDDIATGAYSDIKRATEIAKLLITRVGMNDELGPINYEIDENNAFVSSVSNETSREIDIEVRKLLKQKYDETYKLLSDNKDILENIARLLKEKETVTGSQIRALVARESFDDVMNGNVDLEKYY